MGIAAHYKKNVVADANGQSNITYLDQEGRVIATALTGSPPNGLIPLMVLLQKPLPWIS
ncbi:MAG: hypothetical protein HC905_20030 [Bacteroidales bacterium]|nr:hypothetical protein [Bacteroidales bacterium]